MSSCGGVTDVLVELVHSVVKLLAGLVLVLLQVLLRVDSVGLGLSFEFTGLGLDVGNLQDDLVKVYISLFAWGDLRRCRSLSLLLDQGA